VYVSIHAPAQGATTRIINIVPEIEKKQNQADELADEVNDLLTEIETELR